MAVLPTQEVTNPIGRALFPAFARIKDDPTRLRRAYTLAQASIAAAAMPIAFGLAVVASDLVRFTMGDKWLPAIPVIQIISVAVALQALAMPATPLGIALGVSRSLFHRDLFGFLLRVPSIAMGLALGGLVGVLYARAGTSLIRTIYDMRLVARLTGFTVMEQIRASRSAVISASLMVIVLLVVGSAAGGGTALALLKQLTLMICLGGVTYLGSSYVFWRLEGRPDGPEREIQRLLKGLRQENI